MGMLSHNWMHGPVLCRLLQFLLHSLAPPPQRSDGTYRKPPATANGQKVIFSASSFPGFSSLRCSPGFSSLCIARKLRKGPGAKKGLSARCVFRERLLHANTASRAQTGDGEQQAVAALLRGIVPSICGGFWHC